MKNKTFMLFAVYGVTTFYLPDVRAADPPPPRIWNKQDLGSLRIDNQVGAFAQYISRNGQVIAGQASNDSPYSQAFVFYEGDSKMTSLGTLTADNSGYSRVHNLSADGRVVVGTAQTDNGETQAFYFYQGDSKMTGLGTFRSGNVGNSIATVVSANGRVIAGLADTYPGNHQAFVFYKGDNKITNLGTLTTDNSYSSTPRAISADGRVIVGISQTDIGHSQAFAFYEGDNKMTALGTLKTDNSGSSDPLDISADSRVIVGVADTDGGDNQAFAFYAGDNKMTSLGTLRANNAGNSGAKSVSGDGRTIVGFAESDYGVAERGGYGLYQAFAFYEGDNKMTALGTLRTDNDGESYAHAVSANGQVIVGEADTDSGDRQAFAFYQGDSKMSSLGTLKVDNSGISAAETLTADGTVIGGYAETNSGEYHATLWKFKLPVPPEKPEEPKKTGAPETPPVPKIPQITIVDVPHSHQAMVETGKRGFKVLDLYQSALNSLGNSRCQIGQSDYCVGVFSQMDIVNNPHRMASGLFGTLRLPDKHWMVGGAINFANNTQLIDNYDTRGNSRPGVGLFTRYQENLDNRGLSVELSGAFLSQGITVTRDRLANTEAGKGDSTIKGYQARLSAEYGFLLGEKTLLSPVAALAYHNIVRDAYTEHRQAEFPATYGRMGNKRTDLQLGATAQHRLTDVVQLDGGLGANVKLNSQRDAFTGRIDYIGAYAYNRGNERDVNPYAYLGVNVSPTVNSTVRANVGWQQTDYRNDAAQIGLSYSYHW